MWARIEGEKVVELASEDPSGRFHPSLEWVECDDNVKIGYIFDGGKFAEPIKDADITREQVEHNRLIAYADPVTGSDRLFMEAQRMMTMSETGWEVVRDLAAARYLEIQSENPWPDQ